MKPTVVERVFPLDNPGFPTCVFVLSAAANAVDKAPERLWKTCWFPFCAHVIGVLHCRRFAAKG